jgi:hypothetical protein
MQQQIDQLGLAARIQSPTPSFFKKLRTIGLVMAAVGGSLITGPVALPLIAVKIAGYLAVAGGVITAVSQTAVKAPELGGKKEGGSYE